MQRFEDSISDCRQVLELNPYHFGAASGMGLSYVALRDHDSALAAFEQALAINPGLRQIQRYVEALKQNLAKEEDVREQ